MKKNLRADLPRYVKKADSFIDQLMCVLAMCGLITFLAEGLLGPFRYMQLAIWAYCIALFILALTLWTPKGEALVYGGIEWLLSFIIVSAALPLVVLVFGIRIVPKYYRYWAAFMIALQKARDK